MSRKGDCWDNSVADIFCGSLKTERVFGSSYLTRQETRRVVVNYIEMFYDSKSDHPPSWYLSPGEFEKKMELKKAA